MTVTRRGRGRPDPPERRRARRLLAETVRPHRGTLAVVAACMALSTAAMLAMPYLVKQGIDAGIVPGRESALAQAVAIFVGAAVLDAWALRAAQRSTGRMAESVFYDLRLRLWGHMQGLSLDFFEREKGGRVISRATSDVEAVYALFSMAGATLFSNALLLVGTAVLLVLLDTVLALVVLTVMPVLVVVTRVFETRSERAYRTVRDRIALVTVHLSETLTGVRAVQAFAREPTNQAAFDTVNRQHLDAGRRAVLLTSAYGPGVELLGHVAVFLVLIVGGYRAVGGEVTVGVLTAAILYVRQLFEPLQELAQFHNTFQAAGSGLEKIAGVLATTSAVPERPGAPDLAPGGGEVRLEGVTFAYGVETVLHHVDLAVAPGETLALVGTTGAGKSTIAKLAARFHDPIEGRVLLDGQDLRHVNARSLRQAIAIVPQEPFLFIGSVHDNVALGRPGATRAEVVAAARAVGAHHFVADLPQGYDTDLAKRGSRLSAGERQLISFARAWMIEPRVLILDEATSALDAPSERLVRQALRALLAGRTAIVISHRLSSLDLADRVAVVEDGRIVELGTPEALRAADTRLRAFQRRWDAATA